MASASVGALYLIGATPLLLAWLTVTLLLVSTKGNKMLRKFSLICAIAASVVFPTSTFAGHGHGHGHGHGQGHGHGHHGHGHGRAHGHSHGHRSWHGHGHWHGHRGHWWHGRYWGYGVGSCWRWTPAGYIWICGY